MLPRVYEKMDLLTNSIIQRDTAIRFDTALRISNILDIPISSICKDNPYDDFINYSMIVATRPDPTVLPPLRIRLGEPCLANSVFWGFSVVRFSEKIDFLGSVLKFV